MKRWIIFVIKNIKMNKGNEDMADYNIVVVDSKTGPDDPSREASSHDAPTQVI